VSGRDELQADLETLIALHRRRWQTLGKPGAFTNQFAGFLADAAGRMHGRGEMQLSVLDLDGRPAAADLHLLSQKTNYVYQGGIAPELAQESPGRLLTALLIQQAIASGRKEFDFLRGDESYKHHYRARPIATHDLHVVACRVASRFRHGLWQAGATVKSLVKLGWAMTRIHPS
jgi:CelD/BcsL family acetyltransferase involved in cellulose biosynthesis